LNDLDFSRKVKNVNAQVSDKELAIALKLFPVNQIRSLENLDVILTQESIRHCKDANQLVFLIEKESRELDVKSALIKKNIEKKNLLKQSEIYEKENKELQKLNDLKNRVLGIDLNRNSFCQGCGMTLTANGNCNC